MQDVDDNGIEIYRDIDEKHWDGKNNQINMVTEPLDYKAIMAQQVRKVARPARGYNTRSYHLHVELDQTRDFIAKD